MLGEGMQLGEVTPVLATGASWDSFIDDLQGSLALWLLSFLLLGGFRLVMIRLFGGAMRPDIGAGDILRALARGMRFDSMVATYVALPCLVLSLGCLLFPMRQFALRVRWAFIALTVPLHLLICGVTIAYYKEYNNQFDGWIMGLVTDDLHAILLTIWRGYPVMLYAAGALLGFGLWSWFLFAFFRRCRPQWLGFLRAPGTPWRVALVLILCVTVFLGMRGWGVLRCMMARDLSPTRDAFLNKVVANPWIALHYAIHACRVQATTCGLDLFLGGRSMRKAMAEVFPEAARGQDLDAACARLAPGHSGPRPDHVFLIICESLDAWPSLPEFRPLGLADGLVELEAEGPTCYAFLPAGYQTSHAVGTLLTGLPETGIHIRCQPASRQPYPTALAAIFKRLGYRTRFFYSGNPGWDDVARLAAAQGFDEIYSQHDIIHADPKATAGTWGVLDEHLFPFVLKQVSNSPPSLNVVLNTTDHPPFDCDVFQRGFPLRKMPAPYDQLYDGTYSLRELGHKWYSARSIATFVRDGESRMPRALFAITGDHSSRRFLNLHPNLYEQKTVPCIFHGPEVLRGIKTPADWAGSHIDLVPTLVEFCAEPGFSYASWGSSLFQPGGHHSGCGAEAIITPGFIAPVGRPDEIEAIPGRPLSGDVVAARALASYYQSLRALSWWRVMKGPVLPGD
jgi:hypothetical protein